MGGEEKEGRKIPAIDRSRSSSGGGADLLPPRPGSLRAFSSNRLLSMRGARPFSAPLDLGVLRTGYLDKVNIGKGVTTMLKKGGSQKRYYVVLTERRLHWYDRAEGSDLFGDQVGSVTLSHIKKIIPLDEISFEVSTSDRKRVFRAVDSEERDQWIEAIAETAHAGVAEATEAPALMSDEESVVDVVTYKAVDQHEAVIVRGPSYGTAITLHNTEKTALVMIWLKGGAHAAIFGADIVDALKKQEATTVVLSDGRGTMAVRFLHHQGNNNKRPWFLETEALCGMVVAVLALYSLPSLLSLGALAYLGYAAYARHRKEGTRIGDDITMTLESCVSEVDEEEAKRAAAYTIPNRFVAGCQGDTVEARRRWDMTRRWREEFDIDKLLEKPHPKSHLFKKLWPHYFLPRAKDGSIVFLDRPGDFQFSEFIAQGLTEHDLLHHLVHINEFMYQKLFTHDMQQMVIIHDLSRAKLFNLTVEAKSLVVRSIGFQSQHYVEKNKAVLFVNAPLWMSIIMKLIQPVLDKVSKNHVATASNTYKLLCQYMDPEHIPVELGGTLKYEEGTETCRYHSPHEVALRELVESVNAKYPEVTEPPRIY